MSEHEFSPVIDLGRRVNTLSLQTPSLQAPSLQTWLTHLFWFLLTFVTTTITGTVPLFSLEALLPQIPDPQTFVDAFWLIFSIPLLYSQAVLHLGILIIQNPELMVKGLTYSSCLLFILTCHEFGHYIACRIYRVDSTLPYFVPSPHLIGVGTFGAFIRIRSPLPSRRAVFDIGVAGPIAGFIALIPVAIAGVATVKPMQEGSVATIILSDPLLMRLIAWAMGIDLSVSEGSTLYTVAWIGLLVTSLNLIPAGQLDGGHAVYAVFGQRLHGLIAKIAFVTMALLAVLGFILYNSPSGALFVILLAIMLRVGHPEPYDETPLDKKRLLIAAFTLLVFILSFVPFPVQINLY